MEKEIINETTSEVEKEEVKECNFKDGYVISVRFIGNTKPYFFHTYDETIKKGMYVVVETVRGIELGEAYSDATPISEFNIDFELKSVIRIGTQEDLNQYNENLVNAKEAFNVCKELIDKLQLDMRLLAKKQNIL